MLRIGQSQGLLSKLWTPPCASNPCSSGAPRTKGALPQTDSCGSAVRGCVVDFRPSRAVRARKQIQNQEQTTMGKGDSKTAKGKRSKASYGNARSHVAAKATGSMAAPAVKKTASKTAA